VVRLQAEAAAALGRVSASEALQLADAREAAVAELQRLRVAVRAVAQHLLDARNRAQAAAQAPASAGGLGVSELRAMLGAVSEESGGTPGGRLTADGAVATFHRELTAILNAPLDEEALRGCLISLAEERALLDAEHAKASAGGEWAGAARQVIFR
jgi:hypothetical protein